MIMNLVAQAKNNKTFRTNITDLNVASVATKCDITLDEARRLQHAAALFVIKFDG